MLVLGTHEVGHGSEKHSLIILREAIRRSSRRTAHSVGLWGNDVLAVPPRTYIDAALEKVLLNDPSMAAP